MRHYVHQGRFQCTTPSRKYQHCTPKQCLGKYRQAESSAHQVTLRYAQVSSKMMIVWKVQLIMTSPNFKVSLNSFSRGAGNQWSECIPLFVWIKTPPCNGMCSNHWSQVPLIYLFSSTLIKEQVAIFLKVWCPSPFCSVSITYVIGIPLGLSQSRTSLHI